MDIHEDIDLSRLDATMVEEIGMESKWSLIVFGEFHHIGMQVSKDTTP
jgi:hypothetical protein